MTGSIAIDVVIGLVFIYLLYSLLASLIAEIIATNLGLRARNLHSAIRRMLTNNNVHALQTMVKDRTDSVVSKFYNHPEIKSLSANNLFSKPSSINPDTFAKVMVDLFQANGGNKEQLKEGIRQLNFGTDIEHYLINQVEEADNNLNKLRSSMASWFDNTMKNATEWYKRNLQIVLFIIGIVIAWVFNVNSFQLVKKLSVDKNTREQMVSLATAYIDSNTATSTINKLDSLGKISIEADTAYDPKMDALMKVNKELLGDIEKTQTILGGGTWLPDTLAVSHKNKSILPGYIVKKILPQGKRFSKKEQLNAAFSTTDKLSYAFNMLWLNFFGYATTALALSLGAPFWFDLLNKFMKLRGAVSENKNK
ncbi:MAG TPA: hypothetical protein PKL31_12325 [Fulvivirga sp.]|nr:hypothetical protein [Fulvivirga sp.]